MQTKINYILENINKIDNKLILKEIDNLYIEYSFHEIPLFIYKLHIDIFNSNMEYKKSFKLIDFLISEIGIFRLEKEEYQLDELLNILLIYQNYLILLFILEKDSEFLKDFILYSKILNKVKDLFNWRIVETFIKQMKYNDYFISLIEQSIKNKSNIKNNNKITDQFFKSYSILLDLIPENILFSFVFFLSEEIYKNNISSLVDIFNKNFINNKISKKNTNLIYVMEDIANKLK